MAQRCCASDKAKLFAKNFCNNSNLDDLGISLPAFASITNMKLNNIFKENLMAPFYGWGSTASRLELL